MPTFKDLKIFLKHFLQFQEKSMPYKKIIAVIPLKIEQSKMIIFFTTVKKQIQIQVYCILPP